MNHNTTDHEQLSVSDQVDRIMDDAFSQFTSLIQNDRNDDAIAIGDEYLEWMKDIDAETILFYNEKELKETYDLLVLERKQR
jgi:hypothetical protein